VASYYELEDGSGHYELEDGSGSYLLESPSPFPQAALIDLADQKLKHGPVFASDAQANVLMLNTGINPGVPGAITDNNLGRGLRRRTQVDVIPNLLLTTLAVVTLPQVQRADAADQTHRDRLKGQTEQVVNTTLNTLSPGSRPITPLLPDDSVKRDHMRGQLFEQPDGTLLYVVMPRAPVDTADQKTKRRAGGDTDVAPNTLLQLAPPPGPVPVTPIDTASDQKAKHRGGDLDVLPNATLYGLPPGGPVPTKTTDWPQDPGRHRWNQHTDLTPANLLITFPQAQPFAGVLPRYDFTQLERRHNTGQVGVLPNVLVLNTGINPGLCGSATYTPVLSRKRPQLDLLPNVALLYAAASTPFSGVRPVETADQPHHRSRDKGQPDYDLNVTLRLPGSTVIPPVQNPNLADQPAHRDHTKGEAAWGQNLTAYLPAIVPLPPVANLGTDWQPQRSDRSMAGQYGSSAVYLPFLPIMAVDISDQQHRDHMRGQDTNVPNLTIRLPVAFVAPFPLPVDWPQPVHKHDAQETSSLNLTILATLTAPIVWRDLADQPHHRDHMRGQPDYDLNVSIRLPGSIFIPPVTPLDWSSYPADRRPYPQWEQSANVVIYDLPPVQLPRVAQADTADQARRHAVQVDILPNLLLLAQQQPKLVQPIDWPQPERRRKVYSDDNLLNVTLRLPPSVFVPPFIAIDWTGPQPKRQHFSQVEHVPNVTIFRKILHHFGPSYVLMVAPQTELEAFSPQTAVTVKTPQTTVTISPVPTTGVI